MRKRLGRDGIESVRFGSAESISAENVQFNVQSNLPLFFLSFYCKLLQMMAVFTIRAAMRQPEVPLASLAHGGSELLPSHYENMFLEKS